MDKQKHEPRGIFTPHMKHYAETTSEQIENNQALMNWLKEKIEKGNELTEDELKENRDYLENFKQTIDSFRSSGNKLYHEE